MNRLVHGTSQTHVNASPWLSIVGQPLAYRDSESKTESWYSAGNTGFIRLCFPPIAAQKRQSNHFLYHRSHDRTAVSSRIDFSWGFRNDVSGYISDRNRGGASMRHMVVPGCRITGRLIDEAGRRLDPVFDTDVCIIVQLASAQSDPRIRPLRRLSQPLRVESGSVEVAYPSARTPDRKILTESFKAALSPDGRQIDFQAGVVLPLSRNSKLGAQAWISHNPGHIRHSPSIFGAAIAYRSNF